MHVALWATFLGCASFSYGTPLSWNRRCPRYRFLSRTYWHRRSRNHIRIYSAWSVEKYFVSKNDTKLYTRVYGEGHNGIRKPHAMCLDCEMHYSHFTSGICLKHFIVHQGKIIEIQFSFNVGIGREVDDAGRGTFHQ